jgi:hypothetical protein
MVARSGYGAVDRHNPEAAGRCDRSGRIVKRSELVAEMRWAGGRLVATGFLVCRHLVDVPHPQDRLNKLRADPRMVSDPRIDIDVVAPAAPLPPVVTGARGTEDGRTRLTEDGLTRVTE